MLDRLLRHRFTYLCSALAVLIGIALAITFHSSHSRQKILKPTATVGTQSKPSDPRKPLLNVDSVTAHGHILEISAETEPGTTVMVNGERAAVIFNGSRIRHFVGPLPDGINVITITAQDEAGGVNTKQIAITIP